MTRPTSAGPTTPPVCGRRPGLAGRVAAAVVVAAVALSGCSNGEVSPETVVAAKQKALTDAQAAAASTKATFCSTAGDYITAVDRYGDVLTATAPTVGDVETAGRDLEQPRKEVTDAAHAATSAQQAVVTAEKELADAQAAAAAANAASAAASTPAGPPSTTTSTSGATTVPPGTVNRVEEAEAALATAQSGISDQTPLRQAAQQFNAAAVALELSWLALFSDAGCLTGAAQQSAQKAVHDYVATLQQSLSDAGYYTGKVDGVYDPTTVDAIQSLQKAHGLPVTGAVDKATNAALQADLQAKGGAAAQQALASTAAVQQTLKLAGFWDGPVDGQWTPALTDALKKFQTALGVPDTGTIDAVTVAALENAIAAAKTPSPSSSSSAAAIGSSTSAAPTPSSSAGSTPTATPS